MPPPRRRVTARCARTIGATVGSIIAAIIVTHIASSTAALIVPWNRLPIWPRPITIPFMAFACSIVLCHANADSATSTITTARLMRQERSANAVRGVSSCVIVAAEPGSAGAAPREGDVLARLSAAAPLEAEGVGAVNGRGSPRRDGIGADLGTGGIRRLAALPGQHRRPAERVRLRLHLAGNRRAPGPEIVRHLELDRDEVDAAELGDTPRELRGPASGLAAEDRLQRVALPGVGARVDEDGHRRPGAGPEIAFKVTERDDVESVERNLAVGALAHVPGENAVAVAERRRLGELARTGNVALADVEPVAVELPLRDVRHRAPPSRGGGS